MTVQDDDQFLVCRNSTPYNLKSQNVMAELLDDDLMLVCRNGTPYKATGLEIKESIGPQEAPPSLTSVTLTEDTPGGSRFDNQSFTSTLNWATKGVPEASLAMKATVTGTLDIAGTTDEIIAIANAVGGVTNQIPVNNSGIPIATTAEWEAILGVDPSDTSGPSVAMPDGGGAEAPQGRIYFADLTVGDKITWFGTATGGSRYCSGSIEETSVTVPGGSLGSLQVTVTAPSGYFKVDWNGAGNICYGLTPGETDTVFTLASDANLANGAFKAGDVVKQNNSPVTPVSSAITNVNGNVLTLTDDKDLNLFEVGDVVQVEGDVIYSANPAGTNAGTTDPNDQYYRGNAFDGTTATTGYFALATPTTPITFTDKVEMIPDGNIGAAGINVGLEGETIVSNPGEWSNIWSTVASGGGTIYNFSCVPPNSASYIKAWRVDGVIVALNTEGSNVTITAIDPATPSITTDGGTWNIGEVVTGPTKPITATFVSADAVAKTMTVSDLVGPWSANTGNYVVNTVVNPVMVKPETSAIAGVTEVVNNYTSNVTANQPWSPVSPITNAFDGDCYTLAALDSGAADATITWDASSYNLSTENGNVVVRSATTTVVWKATGSTGTSTVQSVSDPAGGALPTVGILQKLEIIGPAASLMCVRVGGVTLTDDSLSTTLTLTDDTDLNQFAAGDAVYAAGDPPVTFAPVIYTGNEGTQSFDIGFSPGLVWHKCRTFAENHCLFDVVRGDEKRLLSNTTNQEYDVPNSTTFDPKGFTIGLNNVANRAGEDYVAWCWDAGDTTVTNNEGSIESQVRSNGNFSIVKYSGNNITGATVGHGLTKEPSFIIVKSITAQSSNGAWNVWHKDLNAGQYLILNSNGTLQSGAWNNTLPTSDVFSLTNYQIQNATGDYIAYCWAESPTQSFGSYTGNGLAEGPVIDCGFEPAFVLIKCSSNGADWTIYDTARDGDVLKTYLEPNTSDAESNAGSDGVTDGVKLNSNGFEPFGDFSSINNAGYTYIYAAFASPTLPTGVVSDITGLDMTLSESSGTWEVGQTVTMDEKPAVSTTANLIFDSTGAVSGLTTSDVAGQLMSNKDTPALTFGDGAGTGETWDEELPAGTHLQTSFVATNVEGTSSATSNEITPQ